MKSQPNLRLIYFRLRALAEAAQMMMRYSNLKYSYEMSFAFYKKPWQEAKSDAPFNQLPLLVVDNNVHIWQSNSIIRYLAPLTGTMPKDSLIAAQVDAIFETTHSLFFPLNPTVNVFVGEKHETHKTQFLNSFPSTLKNFNRQLEKLSDGPFFLGEKPYYCDFSAYHHFSLAKILDPNILDPHSRVIKLMNEFEKLPNIKSYLETRPELIDVGIDPKMIINGEKVKTTSES